jgi:hypothetical protein
MISCGSTLSLAVKILVGNGVRHVSFSPVSVLFLYKNLLGLPGMDDGSISVIDFEKEKVLGSMDTLKNQGFDPNSIVLFTRLASRCGALDLYNYESPTSSNPQ